MSEKYTKFEALANLKRGQYAIRDDGLHIFYINMVDTFCTIDLDFLRQSNRIFIKYEETYEKDYTIKDVDRMFESLVLQIINRRE